LDLNPDDANAQYQLGRALQANGQKVAAARAFGRVRDLKAGALNEMAIPGVR
jgi:Flp pilus assembly protein TadD